MLHYYFVETNGYNFVGITDDIPEHENMYLYMDEKCFDERLTLVVAKKTDYSNFDNENNIESCNANFGNGDNIIYENILDVDGKITEFLPHSLQLYDWIKTYDYVSVYDDNDEKEFIFFNELGIDMDDYLEYLFNEGYDAEEILNYMSSMPILIKECENNDYWVMPDYLIKNKQILENL